MKVITGHLTATNRKIVKQMIEQGLSSGQVKGRTFHLSKEGDKYTVKIQQMDKGIVPCPGSVLRLSTYSSTFTL